MRSLWRPKLQPEGHMTPAAQVAAAIEILDKLADNRRPAGDVIKEWGLSHRFAGSKDRASISSLVFDTLRKRASAAYVMGEDTARAVVLGALREARGQSLDAISALFSGEGHAPAPLTLQERERLETVTLEGAPPMYVAIIPSGLSRNWRPRLGNQRQKKALRSQPGRPWT